MATKEDTKHLETRSREDMQTAGFKYGTAGGVWKQTMQVGWKQVVCG